MAESWWDKVALGETDLNVSRIGIGSSYGVGGGDIEAAFDRGINFMFWGSMRRSGFAEGVRAIAQRNRDELVVAVQSYSRMGSLVGPSVDRALKRLKFDYVDLLVLGMWNKDVPNRILDAALALKESGKVRHLAISCHDRPQFESFIANPAYEAIMVRDNAAHVGAETEVFPHLSKRKPGVLAFTATRWGSLLKPKFIPKGESPLSARDCYRFLLTNTHVDTCIAGPKNGDELRAVFEALDAGPLAADEEAQIRRIGAFVHSRANENFFRR